MTTTRRVNARLRWKVPLPPGGLSPRGRRFVVPVRFEEQGDDWTKDAWSLAVEIKSPPERDGTQAAVVHFLMDEAPSEWLSLGRRFSLFEGSLWLADGTVE